MDNIETVLRTHIRSEFMPNQANKPLNDDTLLVQEGIIDSLGIFLIISFVEGQFKVKVQPEDVVLDNFETVAAISALVRRRSGS